MQGENESYGWRSFRLCMGVAAAVHALIGAFYVYRLTSCLWGGEGAVCASYGFSLSPDPAALDPAEMMSRGLGVVALSIPFYFANAYACIAYLRRKPLSGALAIGLRTLAGLVFGLIHLLAFMVASAQIAGCMMAPSQCSLELSLSTLFVQFTSFFALWAWGTLAFSKAFRRRRAPPQFTAS